MKLNKSGPAIHFLLCFGIILIFVTNNLPQWREQQFSYLASSFLRGKLYFTTQPNNWADTTPFDGRHYWALGPFPAIPLMPLVFFSSQLSPQGVASFLLSTASVLLLYRIALKVTRQRQTAIWLSFGYIFSSAYLYIALFPWSWYYAQVVATSLLLIAIHEFLHKQRWLLIGFYLSLAIATRINLLLAVSFFELAILSSKVKFSAKIHRTLILIFPVLATLALLLTYNFLRFRNPFESGYSSQILTGEALANRKHGLWSIVHFPANLYFLFFKGPEAVFIPGTKIMQFPYLRPNIWGMSIFLTSPIFLWIVKTNRREKIVKLASLTCLIMLSFTLGYFGVGVRQYGYRYALDFYPFLYLILCYAFQAQELGKSAKTVIIGSFLLNLYLIPLVLTQPLS